MPLIINGGTLLTKPGGLATTNSCCCAQEPPDPCYCPDFCSYKIQAKWPGIELLEFPNVNQDEFFDAEGLPILRGGCWFGSLDIRAALEVARIEYIRGTNFVTGRVLIAKTVNVPRSDGYGNFAFVDAFLNFRATLSCGGGGDQPSWRLETHRYFFVASYLDGQRSEGQSDTLLQVPLSCEVDHKKTCQETYQRQSRIPSPFTVRGSDCPVVVTDQWSFNDPVSWPQDVQNTRNAYNSLLNEFSELSGQIEVIFTEDLCIRDPTTPCDCSIDITGYEVNFDEKEFILGTPDIYDQDFVIEWEHSIDEEFAFRKTTRDNNGRVIEEIFITLECYAGEGPQGSSGWVAYMIRRCYEYDGLGFQIGESEGRELAIFDCISPSGALCNSGGSNAAPDFSTVVGWPQSSGVGCSLPSPYITFVVRCP